ncbi:hypothetical protein BCR32DRAFT_292896 [Anaeromyces robustus]|uniref:tRNA-splicing endonuclease subunit Sen15 domain-containing protein n=1 Tax=Anaeromyces robustus TaxID=1754192 RepID=A0A1Y1X8L5_9FUNG|nr:hypothetical protein BCR32DRAFT_292896 [Anaeromyces robustus]|eukprot:ORX82067.1 hypothetical protein BCR32DRAFT_292896 [Anaeromyces robustus]
MEKNPLYSNIKEYCDKYPSKAYNIFQTYIDLYIVKKWKDIKFIDLKNLKTIAFEINNNSEENEKSIVIPVNINETWSIKILNETFQDLGNFSSIIYAILSPDSAIVYYRISKGIVPPLKLKN